MYWGVFQSSASTIIWIDESSSAAASTASSNRPAGCGRVNTSTPRPATSNCLFIGAPDSITGLVYHLCANPSSSVTKWSLLARSRTTVDKWCRFIKEPAAIHTSLPLNCVTDIPSTVYWQGFLVNGPLITTLILINHRYGRNMQREIFKTVSNSWLIILVLPHY